MEAVEFKHNRKMRRVIDRNGDEMEITEQEFMMYKVLDKAKKKLDSWEDITLNAKDEEEWFDSVTELIDWRLRIEMVSEDLRQFQIKLHQENISEDGI